MNIGAPQREIYVEPLELPEPLRTDPVPEEVPEESQFMSKQLTLSDLQELLNKLEKIEDGNKSLKSMMNQYDISDNIKGNNMARSTSYPSIYSNNVQSPLTYQSISAFPYYYTYPAMYPWEAVDPVEEQRSKDAFEKSIDSVSKAESVAINSPTRTPDRSPDYVHTITGWRGWEVKNGLLSGVGVSRKWYPRKAVPASCTATSEHEGPTMECTCGYWSFKNSESMKKALLPYRDKVVVVGSVEIWGRVIECENGFRSEYAYPKELWLLKPDLEYLSWTYGVKIKK